MPFVKIALRQKAGRMAVDGVGMATQRRRRGSARERGENGRRVHAAAAGRDKRLAGETGGRTDGQMDETQFAILEPRMSGTKGGREGEG